jgi:hypothetical protein
MRKLYAVALIIALCLIANAASAEIILFKGDPVRNNGIIISGWGSGTAIEASDRVYTGRVSIKVNTQGLHEGARIDFKNPVDLLSEPFDDSTYLQFVLGFSMLVKDGMGGISSSFPGRSTAAVASGSGGYYSGGQEIEIPSRPRSRSLRVVLESTDGKSVEVTSDIPSKSENGWFNVCIPFKVLGFKPGDSFPVSRILVFTDVPDNMFIGQIGSMKDNTPITVDIGDEQTIAVVDTITFRAVAEGGASMLRYSWNFGDRDSEGEDATGEIVNHRFTKGGDFNVKLTVRDYWGIKKPVTKTVKIVVID